MCVGRDFCISAGGKKSKKLDWEKGKQCKKDYNFQEFRIFLSKKVRDRKKTPMEINLCQ